MKYAKVPEAVEITTFDEFIKYGEEHSTNSVDGVVWSFEFNGHPVTHETDQCYIITTIDDMFSFTPDFVLAVGCVTGKMKLIKHREFTSLYRLVEK